MCRSATATARLVMRALRRRSSRFCWHALARKAARCWQISFACWTAWRQTTRACQRRDPPAASTSTQRGGYLMKDEHGEVVYVGKAKCLKDRLASYYSQPLGYTRKMDGLLQTVRAIETRVLGSELEALLTESRLIKELQPRYNVQLRNFE